MYRTTVVAIVLVLAASPMSPWICRIGCESLGVPAVTGESNHHLRVSGAALVAADECERQVLDTRAFVREDTERFASSTGRRAVLVAAGDLHRMIADYVVDHSVGRSANSPPLSFALRI